MHFTPIALGLLLLGQADASEPPRPESAAVAGQPAAAIVPEPTDRAVKAAAAAIEPVVDRTVESSSGAIAETTGGVQPPAPFRPIPPSGSGPMESQDAVSRGEGESGGVFDRLRLGPRRDAALPNAIDPEPSRPDVREPGAAIPSANPPDVSPLRGPSAEATDPRPAAEPVEPLAEAVPSAAPVASSIRPLEAIEPTTGSPASPLPTTIPAESTGTAAIGDTASDEAIVPRQRRATPPEMIAEALTLPPDGSLEGRPMTLVEAFARIPDAGRRLEIAHAYWRLVEAVARYHYARQASGVLAALVARSEDAAELAAARAAATAACETARLNAAAAQHELAEAAALVPTDPLPLPADRPHVGIYRTRFEELYSTRAAPERTRLIDRTLPIRRRAIDVRAEAVHAAADSAAAMEEAYREGRAALAAVLECRHRLVQQQQALATSIVQYNHEIADYAFAAAPPQISAAALVAMLIRTGRPTETSGVVPATMGAVPTLTPSSGQVEPASLNEAIRPIPETAISPVRVNQPTLAPPRDSVPSGGTPTLAPPRDAVRTTGTPTLAPPRASSPAATPPAEARPSGPDAPTPAPPRPVTSPPAAGTPTLAPPRHSPPIGGMPTPAPPRAAVPATGAPATMPEAPAAAPADEAAPAPIPKSPRATGIREPSLPPRTRMVPSGVSTRNSAAVEGFAASDPVARTAMKPQLKPLDASLAPSTALYSALADKDPAVRAKQLAEALHWDRSLPRDNSLPVTLAKCLQGYVGAERRELIEAYWICAHRAAEYQIFAQQVELLTDLEAAVLALRGQPRGAEWRLSLHAAREAARADQLEAETALAVAQFDLTRAAGRPTDSAWLLAATDPHAGPYDLKEEVHRDRLAQSWPLRRAATMVPSLYQNLVDGGTAVVAADAARAAATSDYQAGRRSLDEVLSAVAAQTRGTLAFLQTLMDYNLAIADYALAIVPPDLPGDQLVQTLVGP